MEVAANLGKFTQQALLLEFSLFKTYLYYIYLNGDHIHMLISYALKFI